MTDYRRIIEGLCPSCDDQPLDRITDEGPPHGRCPVCGGRWSFEGNTLRVHIVPGLPAAGTLTRGT